MDIGKVIKERRALLGISQQDLSDYSGVGISDHIFPVFTNMLPEGANRRTLCRMKKVDERDFFGMLEMICGMDTIGKFVLKRTKE